MILVLDEYNLGGVTPNTLSRLVNEFGSLQELADVFVDYDSGIPSPPSFLSVHQQSSPDADSIVTLVNPSVLDRSQFRGFAFGDEDEEDEPVNGDEDQIVLENPTPSLPLLLWIDDNPENVIHSMRYAQSIGVHVISITSTHDAKEWIDKNLGKLFPGLPSYSSIYAHSIHSSFPKGEQQRKSYPRHI
jgi:hypothetical protein